ncbi:MAG: hypothetical protein FJ151_00375 [Euryarchaeota archaeon]|nr:hypothetical protein [Euryarchaeota archaeon]
MYPFAGALCFITSAIAPLLMRRSVRMADRLSRSLPQYIKFSSAIVSRTLGKIVLPSTFPLYKKTGRMGIALIVYFVVLSAVVVTVGTPHIVAFLAAIAFTAVLCRLIPAELQPIVRSTNYTNLGFAPKHHGQIVRFVSSLIIMSLLMIVLVAFLFVYYWPSVLLVLLAYLVAMLVLVKRNYVKTYDFVRQRVGRPLMDEAVPALPHFEPGSVSDKVARKNRWRWR